jgi:hypothetical protein
MLLRWFWALVYHMKSSSCWDIEIDKKVRFPFFHFYFSFIIHRSCCIHAQSFNISYTHIKKYMENLIFELSEGLRISIISINDLIEPIFSVINNFLSLSLHCRKSWSICRPQCGLSKNHNIRSSPIVISTPTSVEVNFHQSTSTFAMFEQSVTASAQKLGFANVFTMITKYVGEVINLLHRMHNTEIF